MCGATGYAGPPESCPRCCMGGFSGASGCIRVWYCNARILRLRQTAGGVPLYSTHLTEMSLAGCTSCRFRAGCASLDYCAALPWLDATLTSFSLVAEFWKTRRYIAQWRLWIAVNCAYVVMFAFENLPL